jgi:hypothetical protein
MQRDIVHALDRVGGSIALVFDSALIGPFGLAVEVPTLKEHGVIEIYTLDPSVKAIQTGCTSIAYLVRPDPGLMSTIAEHIRARQGAGENKYHEIIFIPRKTMLCESALSDEGVLGDITVSELHLDLFPQDDDLLTMSMQGSFAKLFLDGDPGCLYSAARSVVRFQRMFGNIPEIIGKGDMAQTLLSIIRRIEKEESLSNQKSSGISKNLHHDIDSLIILDRTVDLVTPLISQQSYEGLLDEVIGIQNASIELHAEVLGLKDKAGKLLTGKKRIALNSLDSIYRDIRDLPFSQLSGFFKKKTTHIASVYQELNKAGTVGELSDFMKKFTSSNKEHTSIQNHINIADMLASRETRTTKFHRKIGAELSLIGNDVAQDDFLEELIGKMDPFAYSMRLLCLSSLLSNGLKAKRLEFFKTEILQTYGYKELLTIDAFEQVQMLKVNVGRSNWPALRKGLRLYKERTPEAESKEDDGSSPTGDVSAVYAGYTPLSVRLIEAAGAPGGWTSIADYLKMLPGAQFRDIHPDYKNEPVQDKSGKNSVVLLFFLGGITFAELSCIRMLSKDPNHHRDYIVATTHILTGDRLIEEMRRKVENRLDALSL